MKLSILKRLSWKISLFGAFVLLLFSLPVPILLAQTDSSFLPHLRIMYAYLDAQITEEINTALANAARILGTGAALTLLATAADHNIQNVTARDILRKQYPFLLGSYCIFFILVFTSSIAGDCNLGAVTLFSVAGAFFLALWFFWLSLILLLDSKRQRNMLFDFYSDSVSNRSLPLNERISLLGEAVDLTQSVLVCGKELSDVFRSAVSPYAQLDGASELAVYNDKWEQVGMLEGMELLETAWLELRATGGKKNNLSPLQVNIICREVLMANVWKKPDVSRSILLISFVNALLQRHNNSFIGACQELTTFCRFVRAEHPGETRVEQLIGCLACAFGMALAITTVCQDQPSWVRTKELDSAWRLFVNNFHSTVFSCIDRLESEEKAELERILKYMEWSIRKKLNFSWASYDCDRLHITGIDTRSQWAEEITNRYLLDYMTCKYAAQYISYQGDEE